jgi:hypothetical protein
MGSFRFTDLQTRRTEVLDLTSLTLDEFRSLVMPFEAAIQAHMAACCLDRRPRPPADTPPIRSVHCRRPRIGCSLS